MHADPKEIRHVTHKSPWTIKKADSVNVDNIQTIFVLKI